MHDSDTAFEPRRILVTGGTGSFGRCFLRHMLDRREPPERLVIYSRDELKQYELQQEFPHDRYPCLRFFIGDVRDSPRLTRAMDDIDTVIHAAALKQVPAAEYNPLEAIKTNVLGSQNVIEAAIVTGVQRVIALSTDKAAAPINLYGATKLCADKLFVAANNYRGRRPIRFAVVRYGNVFGSRGSVVPYFLDCRRQGRLPITDPRMTRFSITAEEGVTLVLQAASQMSGGEIFVPKTASYRITDLAEAVGPECEKPVVGIRPGEKLHEELITETDGLNAFEFPTYYAIMPAITLWDRTRLVPTVIGSPCPEGFRYRSDENSRWLGIDELRALIGRHIDSVAGRREP